MGHSASISGPLGQRISLALQSFLHSWKGCITAHVAAACSSASAGVSSTGLPITILRYGKGLCVGWGHALEDEVAIAQAVARTAPSWETSHNRLQVLVTSKFS